MPTKNQATEGCFIIPFDAPKSCVEKLLRIQHPISTYSKKSTQPPPKNCSPYVKIQPLGNPTGYGDDLPAGAGGAAGPRPQGGC